MKRYMLIFGFLGFCFLSYAQSGYVNLYYDACITGGAPAQGCFRTDTISYFVLNTTLNARVFWNFEATICLPFPKYVFDSTSINFSSTSVNNVKSAIKPSVSPNPVANQLTIQNASQVNLKQVQFWDVTGKLVKELNYESDIIDVADLLSGFYILRLIGDYGTEELKAVKE